MKKNNIMRKYQIKYFQNNFEKIYTQSSDCDRHCFSI